MSQQHTKRSAPPVVSRRSFLEKVGLGVGTVVLSPIAEALVSEARGQPRDRKIAYFMLVGNGIHPDWCFTPKEFLPPGVGPEGTQYDVKSTLLDAPTTYTLPDMFKAMEAYRSRMLLIDGLANKCVEPSHSTNYGALSCFAGATNGRDAEGAPPGGITIDQYIANKIGVTTPRKSLLVGISTAKTPTAAGQYGIFAAGKNMPVPQYQSASALFSELFGKGIAPPMPNGMPGPDLSGTRQRLLFDGLRGDIARLQGSLGAAENRKLDTYLAAIEDYEKNQKAIVAVAATCGSAGAPPATTLGVEDSLLSLTAMAGLALQCGITNVVGVSCGCGPSHDAFPQLNKLLPGSGIAKVEWGGVGHEDQATRPPALNLVYNWLGGMMARTIDGLAKVKVGDQTLWDNSVFMFTSENGEEHHATYNRWPVALWGTAGGKIKADGRFLRFPRRGSAGYRSMADLYCSIATAVGVPTNDFGKGGFEPVKGPIENIMA